MESGRTKTAIQIGVGLALCAITVGALFLALEHHRKQVAKDRLHEEALAIVAEFKMDLEHGYRRDDILSHRKKLAALYERDNPSLPVSVKLRLLYCDNHLASYSYLDPPGTMSINKFRQYPHLFDRFKQGIELAFGRPAPDGWASQSPAYWAERNLQEVFIHLADIQSILEE